MDRNWEACIVGYSSKSEDRFGNITVDKSTGHQIELVGNRSKLVSILAELIDEGWEINGKKLKGESRDTYFLRRYKNHQPQA